jgi:hypothetical protein
MVFFSELDLASGTFLVGIGAQLEHISLSISDLMTAPTV